MEVRPARTQDVRVIRELIDQYAPDRRLLSKATVTLYEDVTDFFVADDAGAVVGCGALHVMWEDLGEVRTLAVTESWLGRGVGHALLEQVETDARGYGLSRLFCLTFETDFFGRHGFEPIAEDVVAADVYMQLALSPDEGVAEFLDLSRVKQNTLGNTRMLRIL